MGRLAWLGLLGGSLLVVATSAAYFVPGVVHPFLLERRPLSLDFTWRTCLRVHVAGGIFCMAAGLFLLSRRARTRWLRWHRTLGRAYGGVVFVLMVPTGVYLAAYAKYGWASGSGFLLSAALLTVTTIDAIRSARRGDERGHRDAALRGYAQMATAITFRLVHAALQALAWPYEASYVLSVWSSVLGNAAAAELWIRYTNERSHHETSHERATPRLAMER